jgi:polygalacturonase
MFVIACVFLTGCERIEEKREQTLKPVSGWDAVPQILANIHAPRFPDREYNVVSFGAIADGKADSHKAFSAAIDKCNAEGGGHVVVPSGAYISNGPIHLKSNVNFVVSKGATIVFGTDPNFYLPVVLTRWESTELHNYSPLVYAYQATNIAITGEGTLDGSGNIFTLNRWQKIQTHDVKMLRQMGNDGVPVCQRVFGPGHFLRPNFVQPFGCKNVLIEGIKLINSPFWTIDLPFCTNVIVRNVTIDSHNLNDDGCDPDSSVNVLIENCSFATCDDSIAIKSGRDQDGWRVGQPSENIIIRNCNFSSSDGAIAIGSEMSGGVRNVFIENCTLAQMERALHIKSNLDRGGTVENVWIRNIKINSCNNAIEIHNDYGGYRGNKYPATFRNFTFENITCQDTDLPIRIKGLPQTPITDVTLKDVTISHAKKPAEIEFINDLELKNVTVNSKPFERSTK